jgi:hypothetical protein
MGVWFTMNEQEFIKEAKSRGISKKNIEITINAYNRIKPHSQSVSYDELLLRIIKIQENEKNNPRSLIEFR